MSHPHQFDLRHLGNSEEEVKQMLDVIGVDSLDTLIDQTIPTAIRLPDSLDIPDALDEQEYVRHLQGIAKLNKV
ncbi:MAG: hypothetical protein ABI761_17670, partial [Saprospiraceae bacterium]